MQKDRPEYPLSQTVKDLKAEFAQRCRKGFFNKLVYFLFRQDFHLVSLYRLGRFAASKDWHRVVLISVFLQQSLCSCQISPFAKLETGIKFPHPIGIVIREGCVIEGDVWLFQHVTLGGRRKAGVESDIIDYPVIKKGARLFPQSMAVGGVEVGEGAIVGAQSLVLNSVPPHSTVVGSPARQTT